MIPLLAIVLENSAKGSLLEHNIFNPAYLFSKIVALFRFIFSSETATTLNFIFLFLSVFFITIIFYSFFRMFEIRKKEHMHLLHEMEEYKHHQKEREAKMKAGENQTHNERWRTVLGYIVSVNEGDWKLAVIEADGMLEALLEQLGFKGASMSDRLKAASTDSFRSLSTAWEVHTVRNRIAHEGALFLLSQHEAKRVIALYEGIFRQYGYI